MRFSGNSRALADKLRRDRFAPCAAAIQQRQRITKRAVCVSRNHHGTLVCQIHVFLFRNEMQPFGNAFRRNMRPGEGTRAGM